MKKLYLLIFGIILSFICINNVDAATANISVSASKSRVIVGDTVNITIRLSSSANIGSWDFNVIPSSNLTLIKRSDGYDGLKVADAGGASTKSKTYTFTFRAKSSGTGSVKISVNEIYEMTNDDSTPKMQVTTNSTSFNIMTQSQLEASYSKNNYLSSLEVEDQTLTPKFDKETLEYSLELEYGTESINIITDTEDSKASVDGDGEVTLSQGMNAIKVVVTAENGSTRIYTINATVKELDPINVSLDGTNYSVVREEEFLPSASSAYQKTTIQIDEKDVPAYYNEVVDFTLVGLKDETGNINLYIYKDGNYTLYNEFNFNQLSIYLLDMDESLLPSGYKQGEITIGDKTVTAYTREGYEFPIVYGLNIETGEKNLYKYDAKENTLQRVENIDSSKESLYFNIILGSFGFTAVSYLFFINLLSKKNKQQREFLEKTMQMNISDIKMNKDLGDELYKNTTLSRKQMKQKKKEDKKALKQQKKEAKKDKKASKKNKDSKNKDEMAEL